MSDDLRDLSSHFAFGRNWASYAKLIDTKAISDAKDGLLRLIPAEAAKGVSFLDIGCGSGLHSLAALELGVRSVLATDIDPNSVATTRATLERFAHGKDWKAVVKSVFDFDTADFGRFDIVYSWGVLHHTGDMDGAIRKAAQMVKPGGLFVTALYRRTRLDRFWVAEKKWYTAASPKAQARAQKTYDVAYRAASRLSGKLKTTDRGMEHWHDIHDWLGGYPYEAILADEYHTLMAELGFTKERVFARPKMLGLFGSGCDEFVYRRPVA